MKVAYYKGCLASLSAKELDISTQALAPKLGLELDELESVTCCGAGDIHEAEPDYYLHLNARILAYAEATGARHADDDLQRLHAQPAAGELAAARTTTALRARVNENLERVGAPPYSRRRRGQAPALADRRGRGLRAAEAGRAQGPQGPEDRAVLRLPDPAAVEAPRLRGSRPAVVARGDHRGLRRRADRLPGEDQVLRLPDHPGARGDRARRADPADRAGDGGRRRRDGDAVPALPPLARRLAAKLEAADRQGLPDADPPPLAADRRGRRARGLGAEVQAPRRLGRAGRSRSSRSDAERSIRLAAAPASPRRGLALGAASRRGGCGCETLDVPLPGLPPELDGLRIVHLSDFHLGVPSRGSRAVERAVDWVERARARPGR